MYALVAVFYTYQLLIKQNLQPVKARLPGLVFTADVFLHLYTMAIALLILIDNFPCMLTNWGAIVGTVVLLNTYLWRCWIVYFRYNLALNRKLKLKSLNKAKMQKRRSLAISNTAEEKASLTADDSAADSEEFTDWWIEHRKYVDSSFLIKVLGTLSCILMLPVGIFTTTDPDVINPDLQGDQCSSLRTYAWIGLCVLAYAFIFIGFATKLRHIDDNFGIITELKRTAIVCISCLIPWGLFNTVESLTKFNEDTFPISSLSLFIALLCLFILSTVLPVRETASQDPSTGERSLDDLSAATHSSLDTLPELLASVDGRQSLEDFLMNEYANEYLLFWEAVENYRKTKEEILKDPSHLLRIVSDAQNISDMFVVELCTYEVQLSPQLKKELQHLLKQLFQLASQGSVAKLGELCSTGGEGGEPIESKDPDRVVTIFDHMQKSVMEYIENTALARYYSSDLYHDLLNRLAANQISIKVDKEIHG